MITWPTSTERLAAQLQFILEADRLKGVLRQTVLQDGSRTETTAEHSWHICLLAMALEEYCDDPKPDVNTVIQMLLLHDIVEIDAGDTFAFDAAGYLDKDARETVAANRLFGLLPDDQRDRWMGLWKEFEEGLTPEARYANAIDRLLPPLQAYASGGGSWVRHGVAHSQVQKRLAPVQEVSSGLWAFAATLLDRAVEQGMLRDDRPRGGPQRPEH